MTVAELIIELSKFPQDAQVIYMYCSDYDTLEAGDAQLITPESITPVVKRESDGQYMKCPRKWIEEGREIKFETVVTLPGN